MKTKPFGRRAAVGINPAAGRPLGSIRPPGGRWDQFTEFGTARENGAISASKLSPLRVTMR
jgi:hypothetical protein